MINAALKLVIGISVSIAMVAAGHAQQLSSGKSSIHKLFPPRVAHFTPIVWSPASDIPGSESTKKVPQLPKLAFWSACGGLPDHRCYNNCQRLTDTYPPSRGAPWCLSCHSCGCADTDVNFQC
jgi:hypothetical protein